MFLTKYFQKLAVIMSLGIQRWDFCPSKVTIAHPSTEAEGGVKGQRLKWKGMLDTSNLWEALLEVPPNDQ